MGRHKAHRMHRNSLKALQEEKDGLKTRCQKLVNAFEKVVEPATDRQIAYAMGFTELNAVRPRITELLDKGILKQVNQVRCRVTGKLVRACTLSKEQKPC